jgi:hypothetical protein
MKVRTVYYNMEPYGDEKKTSSTVVTSEVFDTVETIAMRLVKVFTSTDKAVEFVPEGPRRMSRAQTRRLSTPTTSSTARTMDSMSSTRLSRMG